MIRFVLFICLLVSSFMVQAQVTTLTNAILYHNEGNLPKAKEEIDKAVINEKTKVMPKTWFYQGVIVKDIYKSPIPAIKALDADALPHAFEAFNKAIALEQPAGEFTKKSKEALDEIWSLSINAGIDCYHQARFTQAIAEYERAQAIKPADTTAYLYALYAANELNNPALLEKYNAKLLQLHYTSPYLYFNLIANKANRNQLDSAIELSNQALKEFPEDENLKKQELVLLINKGVEYDKAANRKSAMICYEKALVIDSSNYLANYNLMVNVLKQAQELEKVIVENDMVQAKKDTLYMPNHSPDPNRVELRSKIATCNKYYNRVQNKGRDEAEKKSIQNVQRDLTYLKMKYLD